MGAQTPKGRQVDVFSVVVLMTMASIAYVFFETYTLRDFEVFTSEEQIEERISEQFGFLAGTLL